MSTRTVITLALALLALPAAAKDQPFTPAWSGLWAEANGQHRCAVQISKDLGPRITLLCQLGRDAVFATDATIPAFGEPLFVYRTNAEFGAPAAGADVWGYLRIFAVCNNYRPEIIGTAYTTGAVSDVRLFAAVLPAANPCAPRIGGAQ